MCWEETRFSLLEEDLGMWMPIGMCTMGNLEDSGEKIYRSSYLKLKFSSANTINKGQIQMTNWEKTSKTNYTNKIIQQKTR